MALRVPTRSRRKRNDEGWGSMESMGYDEEKRRQINILTEMAMNPPGTGDSQYAQEISEKLEFITEKFFITDPDVIETLLFTSAEYDNREMFEKILPKREQKGITTRSAFSLFQKADCEEGDDSIYEQARKKTFSRTFLTTRREYLDLLIERCGMNEEGKISGSIPWEYNEMSKEIYTDAPDIYIAILAGDIRLTEYLLGREGGERGLVYRMGVSGEEGQPMMGRCVQQKCSQFMMSCPAQGEGKEKVYQTSGRREVGYYIYYPKEGREYTFHDPLTAAILSGSREMIEYVSGRFPEVTWNNCLEHAVASCGKDMRQYLEEIFPGIVSRVEFPALYQERNIYLIGKYIQDKDIGGTDVSHIIKRELESEKARMLKNVKYGRSWECYSGLSVFYKNLLKLSDTSEVRRAMRKNVFIWFYMATWVGDPVCGERGDDYSPKEHKDIQRMKDLYISIGTEETEDHTDEIREMSDIGALLRLFKKLGIKEKIAKLDLYADIWDRIFMFTVLKDMEAVTMMTLFEPVRILPKVDKFNERILRKNKMELLKKAVENKYITTENAPELYKFAAGIPGTREQILHTLIRVAAHR